MAENLNINQSVLHAFCWFRLPETNEIVCADLGEKVSIRPDQKFFTIQSFDFYKTKRFSYFPLKRIQRISIETPEFLPEFDFSKLTAFKGVSVLKSDFLNFVEQAKISIESKIFDKVVAAKNYFDQRASFNDLRISFVELCKAYPQSFICLYNTAESGCWLTASPEMFLRLRGNKIETVSLAGTRSNVLGNEAWGEKELDEQNIVSVYQEEVWKNAGVEDIKISGPHILELKSLQHLKTDYSGSVKDESVYENLALAMHPTPAVGGFPKEESLSFIEKFESFQRDMYAGFFGVGEGTNQLDTFVKLRTAKLYSNGYLFYAGAGITEGSIAEDEWMETDNKCKILSNYL